MSSPTSEGHPRWQLCDSPRPPAGSHDEIPHRDLEISLLIANPPDLSLSLRQSGSGTPHLTWTGSRVCCVDVSALGARRRYSSNGTRKRSRMSW
jgi:hypothetical protein